MYCTTNPKQIEAEVARCRKSIAFHTAELAKADDVPMWEQQAHEDAISSAEGTIDLYRDLLDKSDHVTAYRSVAS